MPYVEVWVEDGECECSGDCVHVERARDAASEALTLLRQGQIGLAELTLGKMVGDNDAIRQIKHEAELAALFRLWRSEPNPPFFDWEHSRRKGA